MMPSRGLQLAKGHAPRLFQLQCRNLSSASRRIPQIPHRNALSSRTLTIQWRTSIPALTSTAQATRNASTNTPSQSTPSETTYTPDSEAASAFPNMDTITLDNIDLSNPDIPAHIAAIPEKIGYLHEIGLNYGWGPTSMLEWMLEHIHIYGGLPWWASIAAVAALLRIALLPLYIKSSDAMARTQALMPITKPLTDRMTACQRANDRDGMMQALQELRTVRKRAGVSTRDQLTPMVLQGVFGYCGFKLLRAASYLPVPAFKTDGFLWLSDLTVPDPYLILPIAMAASIHLLIRMGGETGAGTNPMSPGMQNLLLYGMPFVIVVTVGFQPGAVAVWFAAGGALGMVQSLTLQRPAVRERLGIAPLYKPRPEERGDGPMQALLKSFRSGPATKSTKARPTTFKKDTSYMNPTYQAPKIRTNPTARNYEDAEVIDVKAVPPARTSSSTSDDEMIPPSGVTPSDTTSSGGVFSRVGNAAKAFSDTVQKTTNDAVRDSEAKREAKKADIAKQAKKAYEKRAKEAEKRKRMSR